MATASHRPSTLRRNLAGIVSLSAAVTAVLSTPAVADTVVLNNGTNHVYTPVATGAAGAVDTRTLTGQNQNDSSLINFAGTTNSFGTSDNLTVAAPVAGTAIQFLGGLQITAAGDYTFFQNSDDGSRLFIDGVLVVNNEGGHGATNLSKTITLDAGLHEIRVDYVNNAGGGTIGVTYSGPDQPAVGPIPSANLRRAENGPLVSTTVAPHMTTALGDDVVVTAGAIASITLNGTAFANAGIDNLSLGADSVFTLNGTANRDLRANVTTFGGAGSYTINTVSDLSLGIVSGTAANTSIFKQGTGRLILDNTGTTGNDFTGTTFAVAEGSLYVIGRAGGTNPLGTAAVVLEGGMLSLDSSLNNVAFNNQIVLGGNGGTIQAVSGPRVLTLSNTTAIAIDAAQTLTLDTYSGSNNAAGGILVLDAPLTGTGALVKTQTSAGSGSQMGIAVLAGHSPGFSGAITVQGGALEGRFANIDSKPFGTNGTITAAANTGLNLRAGHASSNLTYAVGTNIQAAGNLTLSADRYTGTATGSTFALGTLTTAAASTVTMNSANGHNIAFTGTALGGNTTFNVNAGVLTPGPVTGNVTLTKGGAGTLNLGPANEFTGTTTLNGGVLVAPVIADAGPSSISAEQVTLNGGTLRYTGTDSVVTNRTFNAANTAVGSGIDIANAGTTFEITSAFAGNGGSAVNKYGAGTLIISGSTDNNALILDAQAGITQLNKSTAGGTRAVAGIRNIAPGATVQITGNGGDQIYGGNNTGNYAVTMSGGTLDLNGRSEGISRLIGSGTVTNNGAAGTTSVLTIGETDGVGTFAGAITDGVNGGAVALTKVGAGVATLGGAVNGANTYSGATTISGGTLRLQVTPTAPVVGASLWLDAADSSSVVLAAGGIAQWSDKSGNARHATQTVEANRPGYISNALLDGQNVVDFTGTGKILNVDLAFLAGSPYTIFALEGKQSTNGNLYYLGTRQASATNQSLHIGYRDNTQYTLAQYGNDLNYVNPALAYTGEQEFRLWTDRLNTATGGGHSIHLNGTQVASNTNLSGLSTSGAGYIGQGHNTGAQYIGDLAEVIIYNTALSVADREAVESYLNAKWLGLGAASDVLPTDTAVNITAAGAALDLNGSVQTIGSLQGVAGSAVTLGSGKLTVAGPNSTTFAGNITSSGAPGVSLVKAGTGTLTFTGAGTHTGETRVEGGALIVNGSLTGATIVNGADAVLAGIGTIGDVTLVNGILTSGDNSIGALNTGDLDFAGGAALFELAFNGLSDSFNVAGNVAFSGAVQLSLNFASSLVQDTKFTLVQNDGTLDPVAFGQGDGFFLGANAIEEGKSFAYTSNGITEVFELSYSGNDGNDITLTVVPEPSTALSLLGGLGALLGLRRRRTA